MFDSTAAQSAPSEKPAGGKTSLAASIRQRIAGLLGLARGRWSRIVNIGLLVASFGLGQGTIFLVQSALVATGAYDLLAAFGTHYSFAILGIILVDMGGGTTLARAVAGLPAGRSTRDDVWRMFCETSVVRLSMAVLASMAAIVYALDFADSDFSRWYIVLAIPGLLLWTVNPVGLLDGLRLSGISGVTGSIAYMVTAIGLAIAAHGSLEHAGAVLGGAFSLGYLLTVAAQWIVLARKGWRPRFRSLTRPGLARSLRDGGALLFQFVPGQISMRVQLLLSTAYLGPEMTALFIYAKQIVTAATQIVAFILRVEFPGLVEKLSIPGKHSLVSILLAQKFALGCMVVLTIGMVCFAGVIAAFPDLKMHKGAMVIAAFSPTVVTVSLSLMVAQALAAMGAFGTIARSLLTSSVIGMLVSYELVVPLSIYAFVVGEITFHVVGFYIVYRYLKRAENFSGLKKNRHNRLQ